MMISYSYSKRLSSRLSYPSLFKADQNVLAEFILKKFMHTNASLSLFNVAEVSLVRYLQKSLERLELGKFSVEGYHYPLFLEIAYPTLLTEGGHEYYLVAQGKSNAIDQYKTRTSTELRKPTFVLRGIPEDDVCDMLSIKKLLDACLRCSRTGKNVRIAI
ncbi:hypothetical protein ACFE04_022010 [Oxalis oulophora]